VLAMFRHDPELNRIVEEVLASPDPWVSSVARMLRAELAENDGDPAATVEQAEQALAQFRTVGDRWGTAESLSLLGQQHTLAGRFDQAAAEFGEAIVLIREIGSTEDEARALMWLADLRMRTGDIEAARQCVRDATAITEATGSLLQRTFTLATAAVIERLAGDLERAGELQRQVVDRLARLPEGHPAMGHSEALTRGMTAQIDVATGDLTAAQEGAWLALAAAVETRDMPITAWIAVVVADLAQALGLDEIAAEALGASTSLRGMPDITALDIVRLTAALRGSLGEAEFRAALRKGEALDRIAAIERLRSALDETAGALPLGAAPVSGQG